MWRPARVIDNYPVSTGSMWLTLEAADDLPAGYEPGHVLGLGLKEKNEIVRHAYTVSRGESGSRRFEHLYRVILGGRLSPRLAELRSGDTVYFHGPFHTPIQHEVDPTAERIILMSTGAGIGPIFGYAEKALTSGETRPISLFAGFREESDLCLTRELEALSRKYSNFEWRFTVSRPSKSWTGATGWVTDLATSQIQHDKLGSYHFHLVGNGEMVHLTQQALHQAGVLQGRVSIETYFNHYVRPDETDVLELAKRLTSSSCG